MNTKLRAICDSQGHPLNLFVAAGQVSDYTGAEAQLSGLPAAQCHPDGPEANHAQTFKLDHTSGAVQNLVSGFVLRQSPTAHNFLTALLGKSGEGIHLVNPVCYPRVMSRPILPTYKTTNWPGYNNALKQRGSLTIWLDPAMIWKAKPSGKRGRQQCYSYAAIQTCLTMKVLFGMPLRQTTGVMESLFKLAGLDWTMPWSSPLKVVHQLG
ncbi:hypothetical protein AB838_04355 [Rhodobacteraceae bacterium (ex Bugula neritina AB1)]|nr:hypothetical protein AB838_04355 [Rhodobacteraceae bacterium (ex Bugula neritina AB1)]